MLTKDWFGNYISRLGLTFDPVDKDQFIEDHSRLLVERSTLSTPLVKNSVFRLSSYPVADTFIAFYRAQGASDDEIIDPANLLTHEFFNSASPSFVQTEEVAIDPSKGVYKLLTPISGPDDVLVCSCLAFDYKAASNEFMFSEAVSNPISRYVKDDIEVETRSILDEAIKYQNMQAMSGQGVIQTNCTRYSDGLIKGRRDDI